MAPFVRFCVSLRVRRVISSSILDKISVLFGFALIHVVIFMKVGSIIVCCIVAALLTGLKDSMICMAFA